MKKNYNMDVIRTVSFVMVIVIHVSNYFCRAFPDIDKGEYLFALLLNTVSRVSVPCFFMLSGALLLGKTERLKRNADRLLRFVIVLAFWSMVYYIFNKYYMGTPYDLKNLFYEPTEAHLWYLYATIPIYMVLPFFQIMCRGMDGKMDKALLILCSIVSVFMYVSSFWQEELYYDVPIIGDKVYSFYFFLGYFLYKYRGKLIGRGKLLFGVFLGSAIVNVGATAFVTFWNKVHLESLLEYRSPLVILSGAAFFAWILQMKQGEIELESRVKSWVDTWCSCSFGIYLIHILFLDMYKKHMEPEAVSTWVAVPVLTAGILVLSYACIWLLRKLPCGKYIS